MWGLGLARLLAEAALWAPFYTFPAAAGAVALACAAVALALWHWSSSGRQRPWRGRWPLFLPLGLPLPYVLGVARHPLAGGVLLVGGAGLTLLLIWRDRPGWVSPALLGLVTLSLYLRTLLPSVGEADTFEFQVVVPQLGLAHPTGYPLYVLLGRLFTLLPLREVAWRLNLASAVFGVGAVLVLYDLLRRLIGPGWASRGAGDGVGRRRVWKPALQGRGASGGAGDGVRREMGEERRVRKPTLQGRGASGGVGDGVRPLWRPALQGGRGRLRSREPASRGEGGRRSAFHSRPMLAELIPFLAALAFAFSATFWSQAIVAEVYTLHNLLVAAIFWLLLRQPEWEEGPGTRVSPAGSKGTDGSTQLASADVKIRPTWDEKKDDASVRRWYAIFFLLGLSLTNHLTTALLVPAALLTFFVYWSRDHSRWHVRNWVMATGFFALGLLPYLFIPLRWPSLHNGTWMTLQEFLSYVSGGQFHGALRLDGWRDPTRWRIVGRLLHEPFGWVGLALASLGVVYLAIRRRHILALTGVTFLAFFVYGLDYYVADVAVFLLPAHLILAIWMGLGVVVLAEMLSVVGGVVRGTPGPSVAGIVQLMLVVLFAWVPLSGLWVNLPAVDRRGDRGGYAWGQYALQQPLAEGGAVLADTKKFAPLYYLQQVEGVRPDLDMVLLGTEQLYRAELRRRLGEGQTVYLARYLPNLDDLYLRSVGPLVEVATSHGQARQGFVSEPGDEGSFQTADAPHLTAPQGDEGSVRLLDADIEVDPLGRGLYHVTLHWKAEASVAGDFVVRLRLIDGDGRQRWLSDGVRPVNGLYPTNAWPPGVSISDYHQLTVPAWLAPGNYELQAGLFSPFGDGGLRLEGASTPWIPLGTLNVEPPSDPEPLPYQRLFQVGDEAWLTGAGVPREGTAGAPLTVDLAWRGIVGDERVELWWGEAEGEVSLRRDDVTVLDSLERGMLRSRHTITAPAEIGLSTLYVSLADEPTRCDWLARPTRGCRLADVRMLPGTEGLANFGDRVLLLEASVGKEAAQPGQLIPVALRWRGIRTMAVDYTVFVHLVGPDGRLHGQIDSWPVQGSYPTSQWRPGTAIGDNYEVRLEPDAPLGSYQVQVGLYDLETMERLPVLGAAGEPVGDSYVVGTLDVSD